MTRLHPGDTPSFKRFLYWYIAIQCAGCTAIIAAGFAYAFFMAYFGILPPEAIESQLAGLEKPLTAISAIATIVLCITVASHHGLTFGKGLGGYFLGNILATLLVVPLTAGVGGATTAYGFPWGVVVDIALIAGYIVACTVAIIGGRRYNARRRQQLALMEVF